MSWFRRRWVLCLGVVTFGLVLWMTPVLWSAVGTWLEQQRDAVWQQLEAMVGQKVVYDRIAPSFLAALDFQNVKVLAANGEPVLTAASIRLSLDWSQVLQGKFTEALRRIQVINATATLDSRRDQAFLARVNQFLQAGSTINYEVEGFNFTARWTDGVRSLGLSRGFAVLTPHQDQWGLRFRGAVTWDDRSTPVHASLAVRGDLHSDLAFQTWNLRAEASQVSTSWFDLEPLTVQVSVSPDQVAVAKVADQTPLDLQMVWNRSNNSWTFKGASQDFRPSVLVHLKRKDWWPGWAEGTFTGQFSYQPGGDFSFNGRGEWPTGTWPAPLDSAPVSIEGAVRTEAGVYQFRGFHLEAPSMALDFEGTADRSLEFPEGKLQLIRYSIPGGGDARGTWTLSRQGRRIAFSGSDLHWNELGTEDATGWVERQGAFWNFKVDGSLESTSAGRFSILGAFDPTHSILEARLDVSSLPLATVETEAQHHWSNLRWPAALHALWLDAQTRVVLAPKGLEISGATFDFHDPGNLGRRIQGTTTWRAKTLDLSTSVTWDSFHGSARTQTRFHDDGTFDWTAGARVWDRDITLAGRWSPLDKTMTFSGAPGISGTVHQDGMGRWLAEFALLPMDLTPGWTLGLRGRATLESNSWTLEADRIDLSGTYPWNGERFAVTSKLWIDPEFFRAEELNLDDRHGRLSGAAMGSWSADWALPWAGRLELATPGTQRESVLVDWVGVAADRWRGAVRATGFDMGRVPGWVAQGRLAVGGTVDWNQGQWSWNAQTALTEGRWGDSLLGFRALLSGVGHRLSVRNASVTLDAVRVTDGSADLDADSRSWNASLGVNLRVGAGEWSSSWKTSGTWTPENQPFRGDFSVQTKNNLWAKKSFPDGTLVGYWGTEGWGLALGDRGLAMLGLPDGEFHLHAQAPFPISADADGTWTPSALSVAVRGFRTDLGLVKDVINTPVFSVTKGQASGDFLLSGAPSDPDVTGGLTIHGLTMTSSFVRQSVGPVELPVTFTGHRVRIDPVNIGSKGQVWMVTGDARLDHLVPEEFQFALQTGPLSVVPVSYQYNGISAKGGVSGLFVVKGSPLAITLGGRLVLQETSITLKKSDQDTGKSLGFNVDLTLVTGRTVEFLWPNETLPLLRAVTVPDQILSIKANDIASTWAVAGRLGLKTGEVNYLGHTFVIKEGQLVFQENQQSFDPRVTVRAEYLVRESSSTVTINLRADGALSQFTPRFDSTPSMSADELQQLVGSTLTVSNDYSKGTTSDAALALASDVGTSFLLSPFEETVKKNFHLDLFTVQTQILKRSVLNRNTPLVAADYLDNTRLFFGKYIGQDFFLQGTLDFSEGTVIYNQDGTVTTEGNTLVVEPDLLMEFRTPLFLLDWELLPRHPETLFVTDNTVTFRWNWSY